jgi:hypothetical protein
MRHGPEMKNAPLAGEALDAVKPLCKGTKHD